MLAGWAGIQESHFLTNHPLRRTRIGPGQAKHKSYLPKGQAGVQEIFFSLETLTLFKTKSADFATLFETRQGPNMTLLILFLQFEATKILNLQNYADHPTEATKTTPSFLTHSCLGQVRGCPHLNPTG